MAGPRCALLAPLIVATLAVACSEPEAEGTFARVEDWVRKELAFEPLVPPGSTYNPGTIVSGADTGELIVQAEASHCFPDSKVTPTRDAMAYQNAFSFSADVSGAVPFISEITGAGNVSIDASAVNEVTVTFGAMARWRIPVIEMNEAGKRSDLSEACDDMLWAYPVIAESIALEDFRLQFKDAKGAAVGAEAAQFSVDGEAGIEEVGGVKFTNGAPVYVGYRSIWMRMGCCIGEGGPNDVMGVCKEPPVPQPGESCTCNSGVMSPGLYACPVAADQADEFED